MTTAATWIQLYRFPLGRCAFALRTCAQRARDLPEPATRVAELAERGAAMAYNALQVQGAFRSLRSGRGQFPPGTVELDQRVDEAVVAIDSYLTTQHTLFGDSARGEAALTLLDTLIPEGVAAVTKLPYAEEHERVSAVLARAAEPELAEPVAALPEMAVLLAELQARNLAYGAALDRGASRPSGDDVRTVRDQCQELLALTLCQIFADYALDDSIERLAERDHLLEPLLNQNETIRNRRRRRAAPSDTDPDTGLDLDDDTDDLDDLDDTDDLDDGDGDSAESDEAADSGAESASQPVALTAGASLDTGSERAGSIL